MSVVHEQAQLRSVAANEEPVRETLVLGNPSLKDITARIASIVETKITTKYLLTLSITMTLAAWGLFALYYTITTGIGVWGLNNPIGWGWDITNFVFWIGIGHAGTLISAILYLFRQKWRTAINRSAEAMTIFAVICALMMVLSHTGRPWLFYWLLPTPNQMQMWINFRSPLAWDVFAVNTYFAVSAMFWFIGLIPDLATLRNYVKSDLGKKIYGVLSLGWTGSTRQWHHYEIAYMILAGISTPLVLSVHSVVSFDFTVGIMPGWHTTIFPPYFVAGAIFSGFAMVMTLLVIAREILDLKQFITLKHFENMNKIILATGMMVGYAYAMEMFIAWYSGSQWERWIFINRAMGDYAWAYWTMVLCNVISPQVYWFKKARRNIPLMFVISIFVNIGMWFERFTIITTTLHHDFLPASWGYYSPSWVEISIFVGTFGIFLTLFLLFAKFVPVIAIAEVKGILPGAQPKHHHDHHGHNDKHAHEVAAH